MKMEDRYLYKAKRIDNGEWVDGFYVKGSDIYGEEVHVIFETDAIFYSHGETDGFAEINPATICQCTGLKDENGKLIWENDIVELLDDNIDYSWKAVVKFGNPNGEYVWGWNLEPIDEEEGSTDILLWIKMEDAGAFCEVVGNVFDNPELLEGKNHAD